jgi:formylglycine-generating enzyme
MKMAVFALLLGSLVSWMPAQGYETLQGDLDGSGAINAADLVLLANYQAGNQAEIPAQCGQIWYVDRFVGIMRFVPAGSFVQGSPTGEECRETGETQFTHTFTKNIVVMETEVTQAMWAALLAEQPTLGVDPSTTDDPDKPVDALTWRRALLFANLLTFELHLTRCYYKDTSFQTPVTADNYTTGEIYWRPTANGYRLPTEGEWERFARAGTTGPFSVDEPNLDCWNCTSGVMQELEDVAVFCANDSGSIAKVATKLANPWGLYDVHGNAAEFCWDRYGTYPTSAVDYKGPDSGTTRIYRSGPYTVGAAYIRSAQRISGADDGLWVGCGFRLVRTVN